MDENKASWLAASCLPLKAVFQSTRLSFLLIHFDLYTRTYILTFCHSLYAPTQRWNWALYLLHCPLNDNVPHWDEDASQDGYRRPKHSSGYQPAPPVTASHDDGVCFPASALTSSCLPALLLPLRWCCVLVFAACVCLCPGSSVGRLYVTDMSRPGKGTGTSPGTAFKWSYIMPREV